MIAMARAVELASGPDESGGAGDRRWECFCRTPAVLLATYDRGGWVHIKVRDRFWRVSGQVNATCPRCGATHLLDSATIATSDRST